MIFYFDFISPYAYLAATQVHALAARVGQKVELAPVFTAALLKAHDSKGPGEVPAKRAYVAKDAQRKARALGIPPLVWPPVHPFNPLVALRVASLPMEAETRRRLVDALFAATWAEGMGVDAPEKVAAVATRIGLDGPALVRAADEPEAKTTLRTRTDEAVARGVFGVPTLLVDGEIFWGTDALGFAEDHARGSGVR
ncbi:MAG TPA: 2-hydroxychromene-2-carboxylate isomerase [Labilithrix sp.]